MGWDVMIFMLAYAESSDARQDCAFVRSSPNENHLQVPLRRATCDWMDITPESLKF